jgi:hypothetical protein
VELKPPDAKTIPEMAIQMDPMDWNCIPEGLPDLGCMCIRFPAADTEIPSMPKREKQEIFRNT